MEMIARTRLNKHEYGRLRAYGWLWSVFAAALIVAFVFTVLFTAIRATDSGMSPAVEPYDIILFNRLSRFITAPERGDILAFRTKKDGPILIGRAVGLPGETITIFEGNVYVNGFLLDEGTYASGVPADLPATAVPAGYYFILPDQRAPSDTQDASFFLIDARSIVGTARVRVSPFSRIALFE